MNAAGRSLVRQAYALGIAAGAGRLSPEQVKARQALARFVARLPAGRCPAACYTPHASRPTSGRSAARPQPGARSVVWPLSSNLATAGKRVSSGLNYRCMLVSGKAATKLLRHAAQGQRAVALDDAPRRHGRTCQVVVRPLLPDQQRCP